jgi:hypothetical protein
VILRFGCQLGRNGVGLRIQQADQPVGETTAEQLHDDEHRHRGGSDAAKVSLNMRAVVTAGLAKLVELVNQ